MGETFVVLGLRSGERGAVVLGLREPVERLLAVLRDLVAAVCFDDDGALRDCIETSRQAVAVAEDSRTIVNLCDQCCEACRQRLARFEEQRLEERRQIASLVDLVRETIVTVGGDAKSFNAEIGQSARRFEALVHLDDERQLRTQLGTEITRLHEIANARQQTWDKTCARFSERVAELERQLTASKREASLDQLTQIPNRRTLDHVCQKWISTRQPFVLAMIDLDGLKAINDEHGHHVGDRAIVAVAQALKASVRSGTDMAGRFGGDEFILLARGLTLSQAERRIGVLMVTLSAVSVETPKGVPVRVEVSCGIAEFSAGDTIESLIERADKALRQAKSQGKSSVVTNSKPTLKEMMGH
jgi:diguanylate cyclase (GGDEF)-like protein